jgi:ppGpp synthetase/RelA/SpoT-type nucleotidyltranferase
MLWYGDLTSFLHRRVESIDYSGILGSRRPTVSSRAKTVDTLTEKLIRHSNYQLANIQDICGVRLECEMTLREQTTVAKLIMAKLGDVAMIEMKDLREADHSGYRAVHLWLAFPELGGRAEIQIRTHIQASWANTYERAADRYGRGIRYGQLPTALGAREVIQSLQDMSRDGLTMLESLKDQQQSMAKDLEAKKAETLEYGRTRRREAQRWIAKQETGLRHNRKQLYDQEQVIIKAMAELEKNLADTSEEGRE